MLYFIRHGKTEHNAKRLFAGLVDIPLNDEGIKQVEEEALRSKDLEIDIIFCSPLQRAVQTCQIINKYHNAEVVLNDSIVERNYGKYESKPFSYIDKNKGWNYFLDYNKGGIETPKEVFGRVYDFLDEIKEKYKEKNILIVSHNGVGRAIYCYFNGIPEDGYLLPIDMPNAKIVSYKF